VRLDPCNCPCRFFQLDNSDVLARQKKINKNSFLFSLPHSLCRGIRCPPLLKTLHTGCLAVPTLYCHYCDYWQLNLTVEHDNNHFQRCHHSRQLRNGILKSHSFDSLNCCGNKFIISKLLQTTDRRRWNSDGIKLNIHRRLLQHRCDAVDTFEHVYQFTSKSISFGNLICCFARGTFLKSKPQAGDIFAKAIVNELKFT
jgi:hypothetical protein